MQNSKLFFFIMCILLGLQACQTNNNSQNIELQTNINTFMESKFVEESMRIGNENCHCSNILYGYDDKYAYAWIFCLGYSNTASVRGSGFSIPMRFEYAQPHFQVIKVEQPGEGDGYGPSLQKLFPEKYYDKAIASPSNGEIDILERSVRKKAEFVAQIKRDYPELANYYPGNFSPRTIMIEELGSDFSIAFVNNDSTRTITDARCFLVNDDGKIIDKGKYIPGVSANRQNFSIGKCSCMNE